jgi:hypothetical protein
LEVLITSKTKWGTSYCVGGLEIATGNYVRLMTTMGTFQPSITPYQIGQVWNLEYVYHPDIAPHVEDVRITRNNGFIRNFSNFSKYINLNCIVWSGNFNVLFGGKLQWKNGSGYLNDPTNLPNNSVGFWISNQDLRWDGANYYIYDRPLLTTNKRLKYKGDITPIPLIPAGTLIRVSLGKWWDGQDNENRCYLQLSGWYF